MIATVAALIATATIGLVVVLWWAGTAGLSGAALVTARFDALRTGLSIGVGGGGVFALYLAWRRQHATEIGLVQKERDQADVARAYKLQRQTAEHNRLHAERVAATTERDAEARRITDLYAKAVEQLGSDKTPVRHGGLYALERLAQDHPDNPSLRQTVVNVLCAYLRAPFDLPGDPPDANTDRTARDEHRERVQEREVRLTAQRILISHLNPGDDAEHSPATFWADIDLELTSAVLIKLGHDRLPATQRDVPSGHLHRGRLVPAKRLSPGTPGSTKRRSPRKLRSAERRSATIRPDRRSTSRRGPSDGSTQSTT
ncbi:hypothetical protein [Saccharothrix sp. ALI-22-I]|uniref:hypothetical protein n=1 Tax=Saccharothrix sp. ALI-22-I TaxID=1933778 RepID=UPI001179E818|nr:hypothetical protein [Saccharothrix sp. ALI-22-I]